MSLLATVRTSSGELDLKTLDRKQLDLARIAYENILWECDGRVRVVPFAIWSNAYEVLKSYESMKEAGRIVELPGYAGIISWESARTVFSLANVEFRLNPPKR